jgi:predicted lysophospholipase L1 biosynthesis ABC-type transport system permease subunit
MQKIGTHIGGTVTITTQTGQMRMRVVGRIAMPNLFYSFSKPGQGAAISEEALHRLAPRQSEGGTGVFIKFVPGTKVRAFEDMLQRDFPNRIFIVPPTPSAQLGTLNQLGRFPLALAGILALMAAATLAHTLITSIRRRRTDLAILKTLGFLRRQISATVAWQATTLSLFAVVIGLPLGVICGRWGWNIFADHLGVVPDPIVPILTVMLAVPATILVANALAVVPGRIASRLKAANVMRTE